MSDVLCGSDVTVCVIHNTWEPSLKRLNQLKDRQKVDKRKFCLHFCMYMANYILEQKLNRAGRGQQEGRSSRRAAAGR